jgi:type III restriction enzyme
MIRRTIVEHLDKELRLHPQGIKVLSLFFIDAVEFYRKYNADGVQEKGKYALMFEEEYRKAAALPKYNTLFKEVECPANFVPVAMRETGTKGALHGTWREEAYTGADCEFASAG